MNAIATTVQDHATDRCRFPIAAAAAELAKLGVQMHTGKRQLMGGLPKGSLFIEGHFVRFVDWLALPHASARSAQLVENGFPDPWGA